MISSSPIKNILFCGYRDWSLKIHQKIVAWNPKKFAIDIATSKATLSKKIKEKTYDAILFIGWSWIVPEETIKSNLCICMHPSPLPKYRGGSPIQHQIINGEKDTSITLFIMDDEIDHGPIIWQEPISLSGNLNKVLNRITQISTEAIQETLLRFHRQNGLDGIEQEHHHATYFKRRKPEESEIKVEDFLNFSAEELYNKIRALQDPYPNAFITCKNNTKLFLKESNYE